MKIKLAQVWDFVKVASLYVFKLSLRCAKAIVEETIVLLQKLDAVLTKNA